MGRRIEDIDNYLSESIKNIRDDRAITSTLLTDLVTEMKKSPDLQTHKELGIIASKYVETLQRSNEQLVKLTTLLNKRKEGPVDLNDEDKNQLFDLIQNDQG
jgi:acyl-homoserine lactone acylase PvdQ